MEMLQGVWKQHLRPRAVVGYGVKIFLPSPPNYVTRSPGIRLSTTPPTDPQPRKLHEGLLVLNFKPYSAQMGRNLLYIAVSRYVLGTLMTNLVPRELFFPHLRAGRPIHLVLL